SVLIVDDFHERVDAVADIGERAFLRAAVDELDVLSAHDVAEKLRDHARAAFLRGVDAVEPGADPVERAEQRKVEPAFRAVRPDHAVHQLLAARVDPALLRDRAEHELRMFGIEFAVAAHAVDFGRRRKQDPLLVFDARAHDRQVGFEVELEYAQRLLDVSGGGGDRDERQYRVALSYV